jgi:NitT/TauT family transport system ATP-binding protein
MNHNIPPTPSETVAGAPSTVQPDAEPAVYLDRIGKEFKLGRGQTMTALTEIDTTIGRGEFISLLGPSGCGKSTLLRIISGLEKPTSGTVLVGGSEPKQLIDEHRMGFAFQEHALLPWATVTENIALPFRLAHRRIDSQRVAELIELVGLGGFENARPKQLSGGMRQRVAIARSLALKPDLLLLDEPFGALDEITRRRLNFEMARIWEETGVTAIMVTHSVDEALLLSNRILVMAAKPGRIVTDIQVDLPRPRTLDTLGTPEFGELAAELVRLLDA